jgi:hypothetical protein
MRGGVLCVRATIFARRSKGSDIWILTLGAGVKTLEIGLIGSGFMGRTNAETVSRYLQGAQLRAITGGNRALAIARDYAIDTEPSTVSLLARNDIDVVVISTPHAAHAAHAVQAIAAAKAGKHILLDKPMATNVADCDRILSATSEAIGWGDKVFNADLADIGPRFGFAYRITPDNKLVLRGGYGIFYNYIPLGIGINQLANTNYPFTLSESFSATAGSTPSLTLANPFSTTSSITANPIIYSVDHDLKNARVQQ